MTATNIFFNFVGFRYSPALSCVCILLKLCVYVLCGVQVRSRNVVVCVYC